MSADASVLIRQEVALARTEMRRNVSALARDVASMAAWAILAVVGGLVLVAFMVAGLGDLLDNYWLAMLLVGLLFVAAGAFMALRALRSLRAVQVRPAATVESLRDTGAWAQAEAQELRAALTGRGDVGGGGANGHGAVAAPPAVNRISALHAPDAGTADTARRAPAGAAAASAGGAGTRSLVKQVWSEFGEDDVSGQAAKVAYYFFLSLPPAIMALFALSGIFGGPEVAGRVSAELQTALPESAADLVDTFVRETVLQQSPGLLSVGLLLALWSASNVFTAMEDSLNVAYDVEEKRSWVRRKLVSLGVLLAVAVLFLGGTTAILAGPALSEALGMGEAGRMAWSLARWPLAFVLIASAFWIIYYVLPNRDQSACKGTLFKAAAIVAGLWLLATLGFRLYVANFASYSATYGALGAVIVLLLWMYVTSLVILLGGEIASEMERRSRS